MISLEKWMILTPLQKLPNNVGDLGKIIVATGFEWLPKVQKIARSGHTEAETHTCSTVSIFCTQDVQIFVSSNIIFLVERKKGR